MEDTPPKISYKKISINSHPRSGSVFLVNNLRKILGSGQHLYQTLGLEGINKAPVYLITDNPKDFQVAVIRNPKDTIFSSYAHAETNKTGSVPRQWSIAQQVDTYIKSMDIYIKLKDNIHLYDFNDLEYVLRDIALNFIDELPSNFSSELPQKTEHHTPSMKDTDFYMMIEKLELRDNMFEQANQKYEEVLGLCKKLYTK
jgi:hypothetical protein